MEKLPKKNFVIELNLLLKGSFLLIDVLSKVVDRGRHDAYLVSSSMKELLKMKDRVNELEDYRQLTGLGRV